MASDPSLQTVAAPPGGFAPHFRRSPVTDAWEPLFSRRAEGVVEIGFRAARTHANSRGFVHGGLISALADNAMGLSCGEALGDHPSLVTVSLALDFLGSANLGQWVQVEPKLNRLGSTLCFAEALVTADGKPCAKAHATFRVVRRES
ncbi:MAG TPA: PaaI family thioesterase [Caulobacteraceae bacterium]|nr:PaaI family thioesterase [Caulobacteraceae bacterium]